MPLSSSSYGVSITATGGKLMRRARPRAGDRRAKAAFAFKHRRGSLRTRKVLHLHKEVYHILDYGSNQFFCRATTIGGDIYEQPFYVSKQ